MDEATYEKLKAEVRMQALENIVCVLAKILFTTLDVVAPQLEAKNLFLQRVRECAKTQTVPELQDATMSDLVSAEFETALEDLLCRVSQP